MATDGIVNETDLTDRQRDLARAISKRLGLDYANVSSIVLKDNLPEYVTFSTPTSSFTRYVVPELGGLLTPTEKFDQRQESINATQQAGINPETSAVLGRGRNPTLSGNVFSTGPVPVPNVIPTVALGSSARLAATGLPSGATPPTANQGIRPLINFNTLTGQDRRVKILDPSGKFVNSSNPLLKELEPSKGVLFPYTPTINVSHNANYSSESLTHSNYNYQFYQNSTVEDITINATFVAKDPSFARYTLAVQHFFRSVTKMFYGKDSEAGTPPPVLRLIGYGDYQFGSTGGGIPIVISNFSTSYPNDIDYISTSSGGANDGATSMVPVVQEMTIICKPVYSRRSITTEFGLMDFAAGKLLTKGFL